MDDLLEQFGVLVSDIALEMQLQGYFSGSHELEEGFQMFLHDVLRGRLAKEKLPSALYNLTRLVHHLTKRRPIVLIDEYDTPTSYAVQNGYFSDVCP
jgi:hypothetical protein